MPSLRRRIEQSTLLLRLLGAIGAGYLRFCHATTRWTFTGKDALIADANEGPVLFLMWHERSLFGPAQWPDEAGELSTLYAASAIGRIGGDMHRRFGRRPVRMYENKSNAMGVREVLKRVRQGISIGMTTDGPKGPACVVNDATLDWAKAIQRPVYAYAFAVKRRRILKTWDKMMFPLPFTTGHAVYLKWDGNVPRKPSDADMNQARHSLGEVLNAAKTAADKAFT